MCVRIIADQHPLLSGPGQCPLFQDTLPGGPAAHAHDPEPREHTPSALCHPWLWGVQERGFLESQGGDLHVCSEMCQKLHLTLHFAANYVHALSYLVQLK